MTLPGSNPGDMGVDFGGFEGGKPDFRPLRAPFGPEEALEAGFLQIWKVPSDLEGSATGLEFPNPTKPYLYSMAFNLSGRD